MYQQISNSSAKLFSSKRLLSSLTLIIFSFSLMLSTFANAYADDMRQGYRKSIFKPGDILKKGQFIKIGIYKFAMGNDGNLVYMNSQTGKIIWQSSTSGKPYDYVKLNKDGALKLHRAQTTNIFKTISPPIKNAIDANLYFDSCGIYLMTKSHLMKFSNFNRTSKYSEITANKTYPVGKTNLQEILKCGDFKFVLTPKGNLALRKVYQKNKTFVSIWESGTTGRDVKELRINDAGLSLYSNSSNIIWSRYVDDGVSKHPAFLVSLRLYDSGLLALCGWKVKNLGLTGNKPK